VFLFKTSEYSGELISSAEGKMEWIKRTELSNLETVADLPELLSVFDRDDLSEFQYVVTGEQWKVILH
jgi:8-oxo-dGTP diphosphatase